MDQLDSAPKAQHPWWVKHERMLVTVAFCSFGTAVVLPFVGAGNLHICLAVMVPFLAVPYHWKGKLARYLVTCVFAWAGIGLFIFLFQSGVIHMVATISGLALGSVGAAFKSSRFLAEDNA